MKSLLASKIISSTCDFSSTLFCVSSVKEPNSFQTESISSEILDKSALALSFISLE